MIDLKDMETTADGSMVKVDMTDEGVRKSEPQGRFISIEQAIFLEVNGKCTIRRKHLSEEFEKDEHGKIFVKYLQKPLIDSYGPYGVYPPADAEKGEQTGKWQRCRRGERAGTYGTRMMTPEPEFHGLSREDFYGPQTYETKRLKKKRIAWVQDSFLRGGAEISNELVVKVGRECGFNIYLVTPSTVPSIMQKVFTDSDMIILNNIWGFSSEQMWAILKAIYQERIPYVKYEHDHRELDRPEFSRRLFQNSALNIFVSPIHLANHKERLGAEGVCLPLAIDVEMFSPVASVERKKNTALITNTRNFKTWQRLSKYVQEHQEITFTVLTNEEPVVRGNNVKVTRMVSHEQMPTIYTEYETLVHLLDGWGAGERVIFEAALMGLKIVANDTVGHMSWNKDLTDIENLRPWLMQAPFDFWKEVEAKM